MFEGRTRYDKHVLCGIVVGFSAGHDGHMVEAMRVSGAANIAEILLIQHLGGNSLSVLALHRSLRFSVDLACLERSVSLHVVDNRAYWPQQDFTLLNTHSRAIC